MLRVLRDEGYDIKERELMRLRAKNRWLLRVPNGMKGQNADFGLDGQADGPDDGEEVVHELARSMYPDMPQELLAAAHITQVPKKATAQQVVSPELAPEVIAKRLARRQKLAAESDERYAARKRRRRTRGWAGLPADPPGPPRFPSETTIDESKQLLRLNTEIYRQIREHFQAICEETGVIKKTIAGPDKWQAVKDRLIQENTHLQSVFWTDNTQLEQKALTLDVLCMDVTKRMRTLSRRMTIAEAKNHLGINPEQSRQIRNSFYNILKADHFTSKLEAGDEHWKELKELWINGLPVLQQILAPGGSDSHHELKVKAMEILCRDVMKRLRDDQTKRDPTRKKSTSDYEHGNTRPTTISTNNMPGIANNDYTMMNGISNGISTLASQALATAPSFQQTGMSHNAYSDMQIDPTLLLAANDPSIAISHNRSHLQSSPLAIPIYFRLSPLSNIQTNTKLWLGTLNSTSVHELRHLALEKHEHEHAAIQVVKIEGVVRSEHSLHGQGQGKEVSFAIDEDDELRAYLNHVEGGKATFVVQLIGLS